MGQLLDVESAGRDVGRDQQVRGAGSQPPHHPVPLLLVQAAVQRLGPVAAAVQRLREGVDLFPRAAEDDRRGRGLQVEDAAERGRLRRAGHHVGGLPDLRHVARGHGFVPDLDPDRVLQVAAGDALDARRHRRGEQHGLPRLGDGGEDGVQLVGEAHVEHLVGLVEDDRLQL